MVVVDTSVLSLAFRRRDANSLSPPELEIVGRVKRLAMAGSAVLIGMVRQETLSGVRSEKQFEQLKTVLDGFPHLPTDRQDHDLAAGCFNRCRARGISAGDVDMLICAVALRHSARILTVDDDFRHYVRCLPVSLYELV